MIKRKKEIHKIEILLFVVVVILFANVFVISASTKEEIIVEYYYYNSCDGCTEGEYFENELKEMVSDVVGEEEYTFLLKDVSKEEYYLEFLDVTKSEKREGYEPQPPLLKIGDTFLFGLDEIAEKSRGVLIQEVKEEESSPEGIVESLKGVNPDDAFFVYFYMSGCGDCQKVEKYLEAIDKTFYTEDQQETKLKMVYVNIGELENIPLANWFYDKYQVKEEDRKAPALFYQNGYLQGFEDIRDGMPKVMENGTAKGWQDIIYQPQKAETSFSLGDWGVLIVTGFVNGLNPCGLSMLLLVISLLLAKKENILKLGMSFVLAKLVTYLLLGTIFSAVIGELGSTISSSVQSVLKGILAAVFVLFAVLNFLDLYLAKKEKYGKMKLQLPGQVKEFNRKYLEKIMEKSSKSMVGILFLAGIVVSIGEFLCTGQLYLASIIYMIEGQSVFQWSVFLRFLVYLICMCIPLIVVIIITARSAKLLSVSEQIRKKIPLIKLLYGGVFLVFAVLILIM